MSNGARMAAEDAEKEEPCPICCDDLPDTGRAILPCGHVFCYTCIVVWTKTKAICPTCRVEFMKITKTLTAEDMAKEEARRKKQAGKTKKDKGNDATKNGKDQKKRCTKKANKIKSPRPGVHVKTFRLRDKAKKKKPPTLTPQWLIDYRRRQEEHRQALHKQAQARAQELAAEAKRVADEAAEKARALRARLERAKAEGESRSNNMDTENTARKRTRGLKDAATGPRKRAAAAQARATVGAADMEVVQRPSRSVPAAGTPASALAPAPRSNLPLEAALRRQAVEAAVRRQVAMAVPAEGGRHIEPPGEQGEGEWAGGGEGEREGEGEGEREGEREGGRGRQRAGLPRQWLYMWQAVGRQSPWGVS
eukprot:g10622.t1